MVSGVVDLPGAWCALCVLGEGLTARTKCSETTPDEQRLRFR